MNSHDPGNHFFNAAINEVIMNYSHLNSSLYSIIAGMRERAKNRVHG
jgi:hypothetical protein